LVRREEKCDMIFSLTFSLNFLQLVRREEKGDVIFSLNFLELVRRKKGRKRRKISFIFFFHVPLIW
jgi:hypothetical protein